MDRKGQTWHLKSTVLTILSSDHPTPRRQYWVHSVVYLDHASSRYLGGKHELPEALGEPFESYKGLQRLT